MKKEKLHVRLSDNRKKKLQQSALERDKTITQIIEEWIDNIQSG